jgi:hypothetical protein
LERHPSGLPDLRRNTAHQILQAIADESMVDFCRGRTPATVRHPGTHRHYARRGPRYERDGNGVHQRGYGWITPAEGLCTRPEGAGLATSYAYAAVQDGSETSGGSAAALAALASRNTRDVGSANAGEGRSRTSIRLAIVPRRRVPRKPLAMHGSNPKVKQPHDDTEAVVQNLILVQNSAYLLPSFLITLYPHQE